MVTMKVMDADGFTGKKERLIGPERKAEINTLRESWAHQASRYLERHGATPTATTGWT